MSIHWTIHRLEKRADGFGPAAMVGEVEAADGAGTLHVLDEAWREVLEELFEQEHTVIAGREERAEGQMAVTTVDILPPWKDETLALARSRLPRVGLIAVEAAPG